MVTPHLHLIKVCYTWPVCDLILLLILKKYLIIKIFAMKKINYQPKVIFGSLMLLCTVLFSFSFKTAETIFGGEGFEVYLNNKVILQQYGEEMNTVKTIRFDQNASGGELGIRYYHCGQPGKNRVITIKDEQNVVLKEWKFGDAKDATAKVCCNVKDIFALPKLKERKKVNLYYSSAQLPNGRLLAILTTAPKNNTAQP